MDSPIEQPGRFYLGREMAGSEPEPTRPVLYDSRDLTTHAVCVGMTGSGKTGLCISLLEEAALQGIPAICIDPKGDLSNLLLTFPELRGEDFLPWVDPREAQRKNMTPEAFAEDRANLWRKGLADWAQDGSRIARLRQRVDLPIYTPGSGAGLELAVLRSFSAPPPEAIPDADLLRERIASTVSGVLELLGRDADPVRSREHILLSTILERAWREGRDLDFAALIHAIQQPPFDRVGVLDLDAFFPPRDRFDLAMAVNNLIASPVFSAWTRGEPLDIDRLLHLGDGTPRLSILSISHLSESERMFFVTLLLNEVVAWVRRQSGTSSLRAILYMDEVFGFFPPVAEPPSKRPMLTLLKQARAYGLGCVLATQNPVDLDYKGLSNAGTWFLGRLQTERDKARVLEGLERASAEVGANIDRAELDRTLSALPGRVFVVNNVHEKRPLIMHTRWAMSYLRGPLTRDHIRALMRGRKPAPESAPRASPAQPDSSDVSRALPPVASEPETSPGVPPTAPAGRPLLAPDVPQGFLPPARGSRVRSYQPALLARCSLHYVRAGASLDEWVDLNLWIPLDDRLDLSRAREIDLAPADLLNAPIESAAFEPLPEGASDPRRYPRWSKDLRDALYAQRAVAVLHAPDFDLFSTIAEGREAFLRRVRDASRQRLDAELDALRQRFASKLEAMEDRVRKAQQRVEVERGQARHARINAASGIGSSILRAILGKGRSARSGIASASRAIQQQGDVKRAEENVEALRAQLRALQIEFEDERERARERLSPEHARVEEIRVPPRKGDMRIDGPVLAWSPLDDDRREAFALGPPILA